MKKIASLLVITCALALSSCSSDSNNYAAIDSYPKVTGKFVGKNLLEQSK